MRQAPSTDPASESPGGNSGSSSCGSSRGGGGVGRAGLWLKLDAVALLKSYGPAGGDFRWLGQPEAAYLPGFQLKAVG